MIHALHLQSLSLIYTAHPNACNSPSHLLVCQSPSLLPPNPILLTKRTRRRLPGTLLPIHTLLERPHLSTRIRVPNLVRPSISTTIPECLSADIPASIRQPTHSIPDAPRTTGISPIEHTLHPLSTLRPGLLLHLPLPVALATERCVGPARWRLVVDRLLAPLVERRAS